MNENLRHGVVIASLACTFLLAGGCGGAQSRADKKVGEKGEVGSAEAEVSQSAMRPQVDLEALARQFKDVEAPDSLRLRAARSLFDARATLLADYYAQRDSGFLHGLHLTRLFDIQGLQVICATAAPGPS